MTSAQGFCNGFWLRYILGESRQRYIETRETYIFGTISIKFLSAGFRVPVPDKRPDLESG